MWAPLETNLFPFEALWMQIMMMYSFFDAHVNCMWNFKKIAMYQICAWNFLNSKGIYKSHLPIKGKHVGIVPVYKHGNKLDPGKYGSISVLSNIHIFCWKKRWRIIELIILSTSIKLCVHPNIGSANIALRNMHC